MRNLLVMAVIAIGFGALAVWGMSTWIEGKSSPTAEAAVHVPVATIVVAGRDIEAGSLLVREDLREIPWPHEERPQGTHERVDDLLATGRLYLATPAAALMPLLEQHLAEEAPAPVIEPEPEPEPEPEVVQQREPATTSVRVNRNQGRTVYDVNVAH